MRLYQGNARELLGKKIDCNVRRFGYYPMEIIEINGKLPVEMYAGFMGIIQQYLFNYAIRQSMATAVHLE